MIIQYNMMFIINVFSSIVSVYILSQMIRFLRKEKGNRVERKNL